MRRTSSLFSLVLLVSTAACAFDGGVDDFGDPGSPPAGEDPLGDPPGDPVGDPGADQDPLPEPAQRYFASGEDTRRGLLVEGSFQDSAQADGVAEVVLAEIDRDEERLEHSWLFATLPAGSFELEMIALPYSPNPSDRFIVEYKTELERGHTELMLLHASDQLVTYAGEIVLPEASSLELRVKLPNGVKVIDDNSPSFGGFGDGEDEATREIEVDYLALTAR